MSRSNNGARCASARRRRCARALSLPFVPVRNGEANTVREDNAQFSAGGRSFSPAASSQVRHARFQTGWLLPRGRFNVVAWETLLARGGLPLFREIATMPHATRADAA